MDLRRLRIGEWIAGLAGAVLLVALFLSWSGGRSGWQVMSVTDLVLALVAVAAMGAWLTVAVQPTAAIGVAYEALLTIVALVGLILALIRVAGLDDAAFGAGLGLAGSAGVLAGCLLGMRDERPSKPGKPTDGTGRPVPPPPEIERIPAPKPGS